MRDLYSKLTAEEKLKLDSLVLNAAIEEIADAAATEALTGNAAGAITAAITASHVLDPNNINERREIEMGMLASPDGEKRPTLEQLKAALANSTITIDERVRDGLQITDVNVTEIATKAVSAVLPPTPEPGKTPN